ncbi:hypothetical protein HA402_008461 [Bradysia odoriphaga]|nr:hypothetical protein HA402_008461 [Bradysia odoriphaga]
MNKEAKDSNFDAIWLFVEDKLQTSVPTYVKNVLQTCGYNNGISITLIDAEDIAYMESEVRNGNATKDLDEAEEKTFFEGCTKKKDDFVFTMGHRKFLMYIVNFLKKYSAEHGSHSFTSNNCKRKATSEVKDTAKSHKSCHDTAADAQNLEARNISAKMEHTSSLSGSSNGLLQIFMKSAQRHSERSKHGYRHDNVTKMFAGYIKMIGGLLAYETLHANFPLSLPSVSTVNRFITDNGPKIIEGEIRVDELLQYLESRNMPLRISISEDGTRCIPKISYDPKTNQLTGFALPLDSNGMPIVSSFPARNVREIYQHYTNPSNFISSTAYVQMAQPTEPANAPPFCLMMYSTDNKFTALDVYRRWNFQASRLNDKGIKINNIASDGDPRLLMAMKILSRIGQPNESYLNCEWFSCGGYVETTFTQDYVHIITKARNRILKYSRIFPIGDKVISSSHLKYLIDNVSKDKHLLTFSDIEPKDRQNFPSAEKICSEKTMECLLDYVPGSEGTVVYLKAMRKILNAFQKTESTSEERIRSIWYACFFGRAWRSWILNSEKSKMSAQKKPKNYYNLKNNFMSSNYYTCIELNAHSLVKQTLVEDEYLREKNSHGHFEKKNVPNERSNYFFASLFDSQVCESIFRQVRSFTSTFCTVVNFSILEIINRIRKIQLQSEIINACNGRIQFPRFERKVDDISKNIAGGRQPFDVLSRKTIISQIEEARNDVIVDLKSVGIDTSKLDFRCQIQPAYEEDLQQINFEQYYDSSDSELEDEDDEENSQNSGVDFSNDNTDEYSEIQDDVNFLSGITGELMLKDYTPILQKQFDENSENSFENPGDVTIDEIGPFTIVVDGTGKSKVVRKSAVCYVLNRDKYKLSSDRLQRVQEKEYSGHPSRITMLPSEDSFNKNQEISIGDWCIFPDCVEKEDPSDCESNSVLLGLVLGLSYLKGKTFKEREFTKSFASLQSNPAKPVGVMCDLYSFNKSGALSNVPGDKHKFIEIDYYIGTIRPPIKENRGLVIPQGLVIELNKIDVHEAMSMQQELMDTVSSPINVDVDSGVSVNEMELITFEGSKVDDLVNSMAFENDDYVEHEVEYLEHVEQMASQMDISTADEIEFRTIDECNFIEIDGSMASYNIDVSAK